MPITTHVNQTLSLTCNISGFGLELSATVADTSVLTITPNTEVRNLFVIAGRRVGFTTLSLSAINGGKGSYTVLVLP